MLINKLSLDEYISGYKNFVSHAHTDHIKGIEKYAKIIASKETVELINTRFKKNVVEEENKYNIEMLDAGHILGSKQLLIKLDGFDLLYSGDYQMEKNITCKEIEIKNADILLIDSTYPYRDIIFDEKNIIIDKIQRFVKEYTKKGIVLFGTYSLGKAQEIIKIVNEIGIKPIVDKKIHEINQVYIKNNVSLDYASYFKDSSEIGEIVRDNFVGIVSINKLYDMANKISFAYGKKVYTAVATGFAKLFKFNTTMQFDLSDHADFKQAIEYINAVNPKKIYTYGNNASIFAEELNSIGIRAEPIEELYNYNKISSI